VRLSVPSQAGARRAQLQPAMPRVLGRRVERARAFGLYLRVACHSIANKKAEANHVSTVTGGSFVTSHGNLRQESDLLGRFERDAERAGLVGEKKNAKVILLAAVSAKLHKPLNVNVGGSSSAGKNHLIGTIARFIPDENKKFLTGMSPKALMHSGEDEFQNKAVFIAEYEGVAGADYPIRTMQSEQVIEWEFVESSNKGLQKKSKRVKGPAAFIQATTRATLHPENETRLLFTEMDESETQTRAIKHRQAQEAALGASPVPAELFDRWHDLFRSLLPAPVRIPFAPQLAASIPDSRVRSRRDFPKLLSLIEASAFLHQHNRARDAQRRIVATPQDYLIAKGLFEHCYHTGPESKVGELLKAAQALGVADLIEATGWRKSKTYQVVARAEELGHIAPTEGWGRYRLLTIRAEGALNLPAKVRLTAEDFRISTGGGGESFHNSTFPRGEGGIPDGKMENSLEVARSDGAVADEKTRDVSLDHIAEEVPA
jgi:hypothetical protein